MPRAVVGVRSCQESGPPGGPPLLPCLSRVCAQKVQQAVLPVLVRLLGECGADGGEDVPSVLCQLVEGSPDLQRAATDADAIAKLAVFVKDAGCPPRRKVRGRALPCCSLCVALQYTKTGVQGANMCAFRAGAGGAAAGAAP